MGVVEMYRCGLVGVVVRRYINTGILIIIITFHYSTCISSFWQYPPYFFVHFLNGFLFFIIFLKLLRAK